MITKLTKLDSKVEVTKVGHFFVNGTKKRGEKSGGKSVVKM